jgi:hypothetical protein
MVLECVNCHDPHSGVVQQLKASLSPIHTQCEECHYKQAKNQKISAHVSIKVTCDQCHMPAMFKLAWGNPEKFVGDIHSHRMAIDPTMIDQLVKTGNTETYMISPTGLDYACRHCHLPSTALAKTDDVLISAASGYHDQIIVSSP